MNDYIWILLKTKKESRLFFILDYKSHHDLHHTFYQYLLHLDQLKEFFHILVTLTDHIEK
ncbi:hypothetical protein BpHYR1_017955 [Brachionus plicatilis]|uniref:Uncharacterized protein n=1 Tax=Brachionus plicatilis TaxID=10195 RepID=A0A3M7PIM4_BRAPC|nr:hypothetical protein BpHYR1_017955 [Brachionus plicatilis]